VFLLPSEQRQGWLKVALENFSLRNFSIVVASSLADRS
jgi:hypothetical protein